MNPGENLPLAKLLAKPLSGCLDEAAWRGAVGRAYYAAFCASRDALAAASIEVPRTRDAHGDVAQKLGESSDSVVAACGSMLNDIRRDRRAADYDVGRQLPKRHHEWRTIAALSIGKAEQVVEGLAKISSAELKRSF